MATARDLASTLVYHPLGHLRQRGLADSAPLGWSGSPSMRRFLTDSALVLPGRLGATWRQEFSRRRLLERLPSVKWFYQVVSQIEDLGPFEALHWMDGVSPDAVARRRHGWIALFWSGSLQSEDWTASRLGRLAQDPRDRAISLETPWPSGISPDGMVFLERSPYGPTWAYFESERTARGEARVRRKLNGDGCPVLIVCWTDDAESVFQDLGSGMGIPLLTTTIKRLEAHGPLDNFGGWSMHRQPPRIDQGRRASWLLLDSAPRGRCSGVNANLILRIFAGRQPDLGRISSLSLTLEGTPSDKGM